MKDISKKTNLSKSQNSSSGKLTCSYCHRMGHTVKECRAVSARVKSNSQIPWDQYKILCYLCKEEGHKAWDCTKQTQCKATAHASAECPYCHKCRKYGHESSKCNTGVNNDTDTNTEKSTNQTDRASSAQSQKK